jgi:hypothetical protein
MKRNRSSLGLDAEAVVEKYMRMTFDPDTKELI